MRNVLLIVAICGVAVLMGGCSMFGGNCCPTDCGCEPVYQSPCCPAPSQGLGYTAGAAAASCGSGACGGGA